MLISSTERFQKLSRFDHTYSRPNLSNRRERFEKFFKISSSNAEKAEIAGLTHPRLSNKWYECFQPSQQISQYANNMEIETRTKIEEIE